MTTDVECMSINAKYIILRNPLFKKLKGQCWSLYFMSQILRVLKTQAGRTRKSLRRLVLSTKTKGDCDELAACCRAWHHMVRRIIHLWGRLWGWDMK